MRMGAFLFGSLVGAGVVMYWNRKGKQVTFSALSHQAGNMMHQAMDRGKDAAKKTSKAKANFEPESGMDKVEEIINRDPELKKHVDEIIHNQSGSSHKEPHVLTQ